jgi:hydroxymethylpyrimidine pyrophosphatase-like HAD family hydrolase
MPKKRRYSYLNPMGKPYRTELLKIASSLTWAASVDITPMAQFLERARGHLLVTVGAGGSFTAAEFLRLLHDSRGGAAIAHTPLSFIQSSIDLRHAFVIIYTAGGNNRDVLETYEVAAARESLGILVICGSRGSKIEVKAADTERATVFALKLPTGRDGYLATNSLAVFCSLTLRAFGQAIPSNLNHASNPEPPTKPRQHYIVLYAGWARPAAVDLESKFSEAGLGGVMLADYRHFAHGRHNWIDKLAEQTAVVAFVSPDCKVLSKKTLSLLPSTVPIIELKTETDGPVGGLELLLSAFQFTDYIGQLVGIDPGRPGVPSYGSLIYHLGPSKEILMQSLPTDSGTWRKQAARGTLGEPQDFTIVKSAKNDYISRLAQARFGALVVDFDGTVMAPGVGLDALLSSPVGLFFERLLRNGVALYFATGRGDSIHTILANSIAPCFHSKVHVSYYNGGLTRSLAEAPPTAQGGIHHDEFENLRDHLLADPLLGELTNPQNKSFQLTLKASSEVGFATASTILRELLVPLNGRGFRLVKSSHSLDVIPPESTKLNTVRMAQDSIETGLQVLTLGDKGAMGGNDHELLTHPFSLSVDTVSSSLASCWNLLPTGCRNVKGFLRYASWINEIRGGFVMKIPKEVTR